MRKINKVWHFYRVAKFFIENIFIMILKKTDSERMRHYMHTSHLKLEKIKIRNRANSKIVLEVH